ncbi:MAG: hypothetical protein WCG44_03235 [bacterium]
MGVTETLAERDSFQLSCQRAYDLSQDLCRLKLLEKMVLGDGELSKHVDPMSTSLFITVAEIEVGIIYRNRDGVWQRVT